MFNDRSTGYNCGLLNRSKVREYALEFCSKARPQLTRISPEFFDFLEKEVEVLIKERIVFFETRNKTLK